MEKYRGPVKESPHRLQAFTGVYRLAHQVAAGCGRRARRGQRATLYAGSAPRVHVVRAAQPAAARRPRGGGSPPKRQLLDAMLSWAPCASGDGRALGYDRNG